MTCRIEFLYKMFIICRNLKMIVYAEDLDKTVVYIRYGIICIQLHKYVTLLYLRFLLIASQRLFMLYLYEILLIKTF